MARYTIGITEAGDASIDLSWENKLDTVDGAILITKAITPYFTEAVLRHKDKVIVHATMTGYGGTVLEPNVPAWKTHLEALNALIKLGFPKNQTVIRVDPIIPKMKLLDKAQEVIEESISNGYDRFRISLIDMYPHVRNRFALAGIKDPYDGRFAPDAREIAMTNDFIEHIKYIAASVSFPMDLRIEACAEPNLDAIQCGCISSYDLVLLGLDPDEQSDSVGFQRKNCLCYAGKKELLSSKKQCPHKCLYCYWK